MKKLTIIEANNLLRGMLMALVDYSLNHANKLPTITNEDGTRERVAAICNHKTQTITIGHTSEVTGDQAFLAVIHELLHASLPELDEAEIVYLTEAVFRYLIVN